MATKETQNASEEMVRRYLEAHGLVIDEIKRSTGKRPEPYKALEENVLERFFDMMVHVKGDGMTFLTSMLSGLIIDQALPNANHRTAIYFVASLLKQHDIDMDMVKNANNIREYFLDSKHILKKGKRDYLEKHYELTWQFLKKTLGATQSGKLGNMSANSFIVSFSASSKERAGR